MPKGKGYGMKGVSKSSYASGDKMMGGKMGMMSSSGMGMATNRNIKANMNLAGRMKGMKSMKKMG